MDFLKNHKKFDLLYEKKNIWDSKTTCEMRENEKENMNQLRSFFD